MVTLITILHVFVCVFLILVVLLQAGKGGGMGLAFGSSGAQTVFGGSGAGNFLTRLTAGTAVAFMLTSLTLAYFASAKQGAWLDEYEKRMAEQNRRDRLAREKLAAPTAAGDGGVKATTEPQVDQAPAPSTGAATPAEGTPAETTTPAEGAKPEETKAATPAPAETKAAPAETKPAAPAEKAAETKPAKRPAEGPKKPPEAPKPSNQ